MDIPEGFSRHNRTAPLTASLEPIVSSWKNDRVRLGPKIRTVHINSRGFLRRGLIVALADNAMGLSLGACLLAGGRQLKLGLVTTSLALDFLGRTNLGQRLEVNTTLTPAGRRQGVTQAVVTAQGGDLRSRHRYVLHSTRDQFA